MKILFFFFCFFVSFKAYNNFVVIESYCFRLKFIRTRSDDLCSKSIFVRNGLFHTFPTCTERVLNCFSFVLCVRYRKNGKKISNSPRRNIVGNDGGIYDTGYGKIWRKKCGNKNHVITIGRRADIGRCSTINQFPTF